MSEPRHYDAKLKGYTGPLFPVALNELRLQLYRADYNGILLNAVSNTIVGYVGSSAADRTTTSDGYIWYRALEFWRGSGTVMILVPWRSAGGMERSVTVYYSGNVDVAEVMAVISQLTEAIACRP